jgi:hypothetical protein
MRRMMPGGLSPDIVRDLHSADGTFRLEELPPGRYDVSIRAGGTWDRGSSYWYHDPIAVELPANGVERRRVDLLLGGRLSIQCSNLHGVCLGARCRLFDSMGAEMPAEFCTYVEKKGLWLSHGALNPSAPRGANEVAFNLAPGNYEIRLSLDAYLDASRTVVVEAGKTAELSVVLEDG